MLTHYYLPELQITPVIRGDCTNVVVVSVLTIALLATQLAFAVAHVTLFVLAAFATLNRAVSGAFTTGLGVVVFAFCAYGVLARAVLLPFFPAERHWECWRW